MNYRKLAEKLFSQRSNHGNAPIAVALIAGLAAGAVISILFAPSKGSATRNTIAGKVRGFGLFGGHEEQELAAAPEVPHFTHTVTKKRKSDIKDLISEAHNNGVHAEQSLN